MVSIVFYGMFDHTQNVGFFFFQEDLNYQYFLGVFPRSPKCWVFGLIIHKKAQISVPEAEYVEQNGV